MRKRRAIRTAALVLVSAAAVGGAWWGISALLDDDEELIFERFWMTDVPEDEREFGYQIFLSPSWDFGFFARGSMFRYEEEIVEFTNDGDRLTLTFPQTGRTTTVTWSVRECDDLPPYDLCLDLSENPWGGPRRFYGYRGDEEGAAERARSAVARHRAGLRRRGR